MIPAVCMADPCMPCTACLIKQCIVLKHHQHLPGGNDVACDSFESHELLREVLVPHQVGILHCPGCAYQF